MSAIITIFCKDNLQEEKVYDFVKSCGGYIMEMGHPAKNQGVIEKEAAAVWVYFVSVNNFFNNELEYLKNKFQFETSSIIQLELNSEDETRKIALAVCKKLLSNYPNSILLDDTFSKYYTADALQMTECTPEGIWAFTADGEKLWDIE